MAYDPKVFGFTLIEDWMVKYVPILSDGYLKTKEEFLDALNNSDPFSIARKRLEAKIKFLKQLKDNDFLK